MKALSIRQPWAWAILHAGKRVENREWKEKSPNMRDAVRLVGTVVALHTGKTMTRAQYEEGLDTFHAVSRSHPFPPGLTLPPLKQLPRGVIFATARLLGIVSERCAPDRCCGACRDARESPWFFGPYGLALGDVKATELVPLNGALGFFDVPDDLVRMTA